MTTEICVGPNPCQECGGEYGSHHPHCSERDTVATLRKLASLYAALDNLGESVTDTTQYRFRSTLLTKAANELEGLQKDNERLDELFKRCRIVYFLPYAEYPIEHNLHANKDNKDMILSAITAAMKKGGEL